MIWAWPGFSGHWGTTGLRKGMELTQAEMSLELLRKGEEYTLRKNGVSGESESRLESRTSQDYLLPSLLRLSQKRS